MSLLQNPLPEPGDETPEIQSPSSPPSVENPPWTGFDVLGIIAFTIIALIILPVVVVICAHAVAFPKLSFGEIVQVPEIVLVVQLLIYVVVFALIFRLVRSRSGEFWAALRWNFPGSWIGFLILGALLYFALMGLGQVLPIPKHLPIDRFFQTSREAAMMSVLSVTLAPFMEEVFFRGLLYPVLARRFGVAASIFLTGAAFGLLHGAQLKYSWAVLIIFIVGVVLTAVRAYTKSVGASFLVHAAYNGTLSVL
ncbi:MAG: CPBP family intramembrane metalloprotease, partial [Acidobacteriaceae bacterium]|nr:CPBP family intramembrane metalloprotease [Acidobacteriaceae bacterium]